MQDTTREITNDRLHWYHTDADMLERWAPSVRGRRFLWLVSPAWNRLWTRQNHFAIRLARAGAEVLYVEGVDSILRYMRSRDQKVPSVLSAEVRNVEPRLRVMRLPYQIPGRGYSEIIARMNGRLWAQAIQRWITQNTWSDYICWCRVPYSVLTLKHLSPTAVIYDITDGYEHYAPTVHMKQQTNRWQADLLKRAAAICVTTPSLAASLQLDRPFHVVPNGVEYEFFASASNSTPHHRFASISHPIIGYVGVISEWMDFDLIRMLGERWPGRVVMVGPVDPAVAHIVERIEGVVWTGLIARPELPAVFRSLDVCVLPRKVNAMTAFQSPLKLWEYLASGKPVVSTRLPAADQLGSWIDIAQDRPSFVNLVAKRLASGQNRIRTKEGQAAAKRWSWDNIFDSLMTDLAPVLDQSESS